MVAVRFFTGELDEEHVVEETTRFVQLLRADLKTDAGDEYVHWDRLRRKPLPDGIDTHTDWWSIIKGRRIPRYDYLPFRGVDETLQFVYWSPDSHQRLLHEIAQRASGEISVTRTPPALNDVTRDRYLVSALFEEAITSSQLEGASTTYRVAKQMLREGREPRDQGERMIFNNYLAMQFVREIQAEPLSKELLLEVHRQVTQGTLRDPTFEGRFRTGDDDVTVTDPTDNTVLHVPPPAESLATRIESLCDFANKTDEGQFVHPVVRAILLHMMVGFDHPFVDGNGRTARALFYWSMIRQGYWLMEFVPISRIIKESATQYARSYLYVESDTLDATYFIDYNLRAVKRAIDDLHEYLARKAKEMSDVDLLLGASSAARTLNHRQIALLSHALRNPGAVYFIKTHSKSHNVSYQTARKDLLALVGFKLLSQRKAGNALVFQAAGSIEAALRDLRDQ